MKPLCTVQHCIDAAIAVAGVTREEFMGRNRHLKAVTSRTLAVVLARRHTLASYPEIAMAMGRPNHSTIVTAHGRWQSRGNADDAAALERAEAMLRSNNLRLAGDPVVDREDPNPPPLVMPPPRCARPEPEPAPIARTLANTEAPPIARTLAEYRALCREWFPDEPGDWADLDGSVVRGALLDRLVAVLRSLERLWRLWSFEREFLAVLPGDAAARHGAFDVEGATMPRAACVAALRAAGCEVGT